MARDRFGRDPVAEPLGASKKPDSLRDWPSHARVTIKQSVRYTRFVTVMKGALPIAALAILASVVVVGLLPHRPQTDHVQMTWQTVGSIKNDLAMTKPKLTGTDDKGDPFTITADEAVQSATNPHQATLKNVQADLQYDGGQWASASAGNGFVDRDTGTLELGGGISVYTDSGYELHTASAQVHLKTNIVEGDYAVKGHGPLGSLSADKFRIDRQKKEVYLNGHVEMTMYPKRVKR